MHDERRRRRMRRRRRWITKGESRDGEGKGGG